MEIGFSTLSLFMKSYEEICEIATSNNFKMIEILSEGPYNPYNLLENKYLLEPLYSYDLDINIHGPNIDLNLASLNDGIRNESIKQIKKTIDLAREIDANFITIHPGQVGRREKRIRDMAIENSKNSIKECVEYGENVSCELSVENMPNNFKFLGTTPEELEEIADFSNCKITIDSGHANTCENTEEFFNMKNISYFHLHDNNGDKDTHLPLGEGNLDLNLLKKVKKGSIELDNFNNILKSREVILDILNIKNQS